MVAVVVVVLGAVLLMVDFLEVSVRVVDVEDVVVVVVVVVYLLLFYLD